MKTPRLFTLVLILMAGTSLQAQGFVREIGGPGLQYGVGVAEADNGDFVVLAEEIYDPSVIGNQIAWYRLDREGNEISKTLLPGFFVVSPQKMLSMGGDRFLIGGNSLGFTFSSNKPYLAAVDADGALQWQTYYDLFPNAAHFAGSVVDMDALPNGDLLLTASSLVNLPSSWYETLMRVNSEGQLLWHRSDSMQWRYFPEGSAVFEDGGFVTASNVLPNQGEAQETWLTQSRPDGSIAWERPISSQNGNFNVTDVLVTAEQNILVSGYLENLIEPLRGVVLLLDKEGNLLRETLVMADGWNASQLHSLRLLPDGSVLACGKAFNPAAPNPNYRKALLASLNQQGDLLWVNLVENPGSADNELRAAFPLAQGRILATGICQTPYSTGNELEILLTKTDCRGKTEFANEPAGAFTAWPVPSTGELSIRPSEEGACLENPEITVLEVFDLRGRRLEVPYQVFFSQVQADLDLLARGMYLVRLREGERVLYTGRVERM